VRPRAPAAQARRSVRLRGGRGGDRAPPSAQEGTTGLCVACRGCGSLRATRAPEPLLQFGDFPARFPCFWLRGAGEGRRLPRLANRRGGPGVAGGRGPSLTAAGAQPRAPLTRGCSAVRRGARGGRPGGLWWGRAPHRPPLAGSPAASPARSLGRGPAAQRHRPVRSEPAAELSVRARPAE
jgi:hypothetical protein